MIVSYKWLWHGEGQKSFKGQERSLSHAACVLCTQLEHLMCVTVWHSSPKLGWRNQNESPFCSPIYLHIWQIYLHISTFLYNFSSNSLNKRNFLHEIVQILTSLWILSRLTITKGQLISKSRLASRRFSQKTNGRIWFVCREE